ncbi:MAG: hypothetical protein CXT73_02670 [Methanobacteriota archaeon]|jgi:hypothetical protein|nr:MAG: hypothetical protein CXT73_02670 [Euryarchaeota archaeon]
MNYNNFRIVGKRFNFLSLKRQLHDSKLPSVTNNYRKTSVEWIGVESPRKADKSYPILINTDSVEYNGYTNKIEYDDEYTSSPNHEIISKLPKN